MLPVNRINISLQCSALIRNGDIARLIHTPTELNFEVTVKVIGKNPHTVPISTLIEQRTFPSPSVVTSSQITSNDDYPYDHQWGSTTFYMPISGLKYKTTFWNLIILLSFNFFFFLLETLTTITSENIIQLDDSSITQLLITPYSLRLIETMQSATIQLNPAKELNPSSLWNWKN